MVQIPPGLLSYFTDKKTQAAVDLLLAKKRPQMPDDVGWDEVPDFFRAVRAARQIQADQAILLHEIWNAVWKPLPAPWKAKAPHEQSDDGALDPNVIWGNSYLLRSFDRDKLTSELVIYIDGEAGVQIGFNLFRNTTSKLPKQLSSWEEDDGTFWSPSTLISTRRNLNLGPLQPYAAEALKIIRRHERL